MTALTLEHVSKSRGSGRRRVRVLHDVSLLVEAGEVLLLEGPSGAGKTTLLAVAAGLLLADEGLVLLDGQPLTALTPSARRRHRARRIGFVFQRSNLLDQLTVRENVLLAASLAGLRSDEVGRDTDELLGRLGIASLATRRARELSGGEEQRVAVARALVHRPALILADEPTGSLDSVSGLAVMDQLAAMARAGGAAVIIATHDVRLASIATRTIRIRDGRVLNG